MLSTKIELIQMSNQRLVLLWRRYFAQLHLLEKFSSQFPYSLLSQPISQWNVWKLVSLHYVWAWQLIRHRHPNYVSVLLLQLSVSFILRWICCKIPITYWCLCMPVHCSVFANPPFVLSSPVWSFALANYSLIYFCYFTAAAPGWAATTGIKCSNRFFLIFHNSNYLTFAHNCPP